MLDNNFPTHRRDGHCGDAEFEFKGQSMYEISKRMQNSVTAIGAAFAPKKEYTLIEAFVKWKLALERMVNLRFSNDEKGKVLDKMDHLRWDTMLINLLDKNDELLEQGQSAFYPAKLPALLSFIYPGYPCPPALISVKTGREVYRYPNAIEVQDHL